MHDLEGCASANEKYARSQRKFAIKKTPANNFIDSVMSTDVFSNQAWFTVEPKNAGRVNSASAGEVALVPTQERWKREQCFELNGMPGADSIDGKFCRITAILSFPQIPQLDEIVPKRCVELSLGFMPSARVTVMMFSRLRALEGRENLSISSEARIIPSERRKPAASSSSFPGVRIVVATVLRPMRISSGSSMVRSSR